MLSIRTVWVTRQAVASPAFDVYPQPLAGNGAAEETLVLTNDPLAFDELLTAGSACVADVMAAYAFACSQVPLERAEQLFGDAPPSAEALWQVWQKMSSRLDAFPLWALETIELLLRDLDEKALARLFGFFAARVRSSGSGCGLWTDSFKADAFRGEKRELPAHADCSPLSVDRMAAHLLPGGTFARLMPGYESRPGQVEMLRAVTRAFNEGRHLVVEAGTGVGKSLAYLIPAAAWARLNDLPVIVSTNTRNLQSQLVEKDLPLVREAVRAEFGGSESGALRVALLKGRSNYFCLRRLAILLEHSQFELERPELRHFAEAVAWSVQTPDGDLDSFAGAGHAAPGFLSKLSSTGEECPGRSCRFYRRCFLQKARARAAAAHVVIANHALVFSEAQAPGSSLPPYSQIVFDEAHNLEEAATRHLSVEVTQVRLNQLLRRLSRGKGKHAGGVLEVLRNHLEKGAITADEETARALRRQIRLIKSLLEQVQGAARRLFEILYGIVAQNGAATRFRCAPAAEPLPVGEAAAEPARTRDLFRNGAFVPCESSVDEAAVAAAKSTLKSAVAEAAGQLLALGEALRQTSEGELALYGDQAANVEGAAATLRSFAMDVDFVLAASDPDHVFWAEPAARSEGTVRLFAAPLKIAGALAELLYRQKVSVVFCSATMRVGGSFSYIGKRLGIDLIEPERVFTCVAESPFNYLTQCAALAPTFLPEPSGSTGGSYTEQLSGLMLDVFTLTRGRAMGLFTSYEMMNQVARLLEEPLREAGIRLLVHGVNGTRDQITRLFRSGGACVLLGTHSFWEGVDVAGEALSCVVMARLPFAAMNDPIIEARSEQIEQAGGSSFREFAMPQAVIRFRQGFGRLIRTREDKGVVIVADPRIVTKNYGSTFRRSLPCPLQQVASRDELLARVGALFAEQA
jgi:ATP-dependent DNA helicase DinG